MKPLLIWMIIAQGADVTTSMIAFNKGASEANPLVIDHPPAAFLTEAVGFSIAETFLLNKLHKSHPKLAKTLSYIQIGGSSAAAVNNVIVINRLNDRH